MRRTPRQRQVAEERRELARRLQGEGLSTAEIASRLQVTRVTAWQYLQREQWPRRSAGRPSAASEEQPTCSQSDCGEPAQRGGLCWGHVKRATRRQTVSGLLKERYRSPWDRLMEAMFAFYELKATDDEGFRKARDNFRKAAIAYVDSLKKRRGRAAG